MYIPRHIASVITRMEKRKPVIVLTGARQVGKSTLIRQLKDSTNYVALNRPLVRDSAKNSPSLFFEANKSPLIIDEIQNVPELFEYIKDIVDEDKAKGQFYLTGSQSLKLMKNVSESLAGRAGVICLLGLSLREISGNPYRQPFLPSLDHFLEISKSAAQFDYSQIVSIIHKGSYPELYEHESDLLDWNDYYSSYFQTYIEKDIKDLLNIRDESAFIKFIRSAASLTGEMLNLSKMAEICGKDVKTVRSWLSVLESSGLIYLLQPYYNNYNKRLIKTPKLYFLDTGLASWLLGWNTPDQLIRGAMWGHIFETFVFAEVLKSYYNDGLVNPPIYYYRDKDKNEIDLLIDSGNHLHPIEIKATGDPKLSMTKAFKQLEKIPSKSPGMGAVICLVKDYLPLSDQVWACHVNMV